ncbi:MAG: hypothetical protein GX978_01200 [Tissierellia bacterium]|nr:hypothetical protein [Tissierellia bacterium]
MRKSTSLLGVLLLFIMLFPYLSIAFADTTPTYFGVTPQEQIRIEEIKNRANSAPVQGDFKLGSGSNSNFLRSSVGSWSWRDGVICITEATTFILNHGHAGLIAIAPYYYATVEANPRAGVQIVYGEWASRFPDKQVWQVGVTNTTVYEDQLAATWACQQIGKPYGFPIALGNREKFYCSQLVYAAYLEKCGVNLDTLAWVAWISPWEILDNSQVTLMYRKN